MLITNGIEEKNVTKGAYKQLYERLGYKPVTVIDTTFTEKIEKETPVKEVFVEEIVKEQEIKEEKNEKEHVSRNKTPKKSKK